MIVGGAVVLLLVVLGLVGVLFGSGGGGGGSGSTTRTTPRARTHEAAGARPAPTARPALASVAIVPTGAVYVCLVDGDTGRALIRGAEFTAGQQVPIHRARTLRMTLGNNAVRLRVNGKPFSVSASSQAIAYEITRAGARPLPLSQAPTCQ
jgi:hypothetical protein